MYGADADTSTGLRLRRADGIEELREPWQALAAASGNVFLTWEWASAWWRHYGAGRTQTPVLCSDSAGRTVAILALCAERARRPRLARLIGHGPADELGPVCAPADRHLAAQALARSGEVAGWSVLLAEHLAPGIDWPAVLDGAELRTEGSPVVAIDGTDWDGFLAARSSNFRSQIRRRERKLLRDHDLRYRLCDAAERVDEDMSTLFELHRARWAEQGSGAFDERREAFHRDFAAVAFERGWLRLWLAEVDDRAIAAWYGFRFGDAEWYYQLGRDPEWERLSVGQVLVAHSLREAIGDGLSSYRLLRGGEAYKQRFATSDPGISSVAAGRGLAGRALVAGARRALSAPDPIRRAVIERVG